MMLMKILNPTGVENRCRCRLKRRIYQNKVCRIVASLSFYCVHHL